MDSRSGRDSLFAEPLEILVLMGGTSSEREVSLQSGAAVAEALASRGHRARAFDIDPADTSILQATTAEAVFLALHGEFGEDGQVQQLCEQANLPYIGSGAAASALAMDKAASKERYRSAGVATPAWALLRRSDSPAAIEQALSRVGAPCVLKPVDGGSSVDIHIAATAEQVAGPLDALLDRYGRALVERFVDGREFTVGVLGRRPLPVMEIRVAGAFYDYDAKYNDAATQYISDHGLSAATEAALQQAALAAHRALGCRDISRSDFRLDADGRAWIMETNTIPGFTGHSLVPKAAAAAGIAFPRLCEMLVKTALDRRAAPAGGCREVLNAD